MNKPLTFILLLLGLIEFGRAKTIVFDGHTLYSDAYALLVSVDEGKDKITVTRDDANDVQGLLTGSFQYEPDHVKWLKGPESTAENIRSWFKAAKDFDPEACVFIYFTMHANQDQGGQFLLYGANERQTISMKEMAGLLDRIPCKHVVFVADTCFSGLMFDQFKSSPREIRSGTYEALAETPCHDVVAAAGANNTSSYSDSGSRFTHCLVTAMKEASQRLNPTVFRDEVQKVILTSEASIARPRIMPFRTSSNETGEFLLVPQQNGTAEHRQSQADAEKLLNDLWDHVSQGDFTGVDEKVDEALKMDSGYVVRRQAATIFAVSGRGTKAEEMAKALISEHPDDPMALAPLAFAYISERKPDEAIALAEAWKSKPNAVDEVQSILVAAYAFKWDFDNIIKVANDKLERDPTDAESRVLLFSAYLKSQNGAGARNQIAQLIRYNGLSGEAWVEFFKQCYAGGQSGILVPFVRANGLSDAVGIGGALTEGLTLVASGHFDEILLLEIPTSGSRRQRAAMSLLYAFAYAAQGDYRKMHEQVAATLAIMREDPSQIELTAPNAVWKAAIPSEFLEAVESVHALDPGYKSDDIDSLRERLVSQFDNPAKAPLWFGNTIAAVKEVLSRQVDFLFQELLGPKIVGDAEVADFNGSLSDLLESIKPNDLRSIPGLSLTESMGVPYLQDAVTTAHAKFLAVVKKGDFQESDASAWTLQERATIGYFARGLAQSVTASPKILRKMSPPDRRVLRRVLALDIKDRPDDLAEHVVLSRLCKFDNDSQALTRLKTVMLARWPFLVRGPLAP